MFFSLNCVEVNSKLNFDLQQQQQQQQQKSELLELIWRNQFKTKISRCRLCFLLIDFRSNTLDGFSLKFNVLFAQNLPGFRIFYLSCWNFTFILKCYIPLDLELTKPEYSELLIDKKDYHYKTMKINWKFFSKSCEFRLLLKCSAFYNFIPSQNSGLA